MRVVVYGDDGTVFFAWDEDPQKSRLSPGLKERVQVARVLQICLASFTDRADLVPDGGPVISRIQ